MIGISPSKLDNTHKGSVELTILVLYNYFVVWFYYRKLKLKHLKGAYDLDSFYLERQEVY